MHCGDMTSHFFTPWQPDLTQAKFYVYQSPGGLVKKKNPVQRNSVRHTRFEFYSHRDNLDNFILRLSPIGVIPVCFCPGLYPIRFRLKKYILFMTNFSPPTRGGDLRYALTRRSFITFNVINILMCCV